ncbi:vascular endothelial growth factor A-like isoform X2 [Tigriopus californicus]|uniref:vascular endothelial growth factor A-like isoform X2 n=1 Tax=Tigriopus californicus TaxID=6832 RepID=UPI0027DA07B1|nr:vascular endothelial growth factor A-like isoform X2 [Tigriopus californicus]
MFCKMFSFVWITLVCLNPTLAKVNTLRGSSNDVESPLEQTQEWVPYHKREWRSPYQYKTTFFEQLLRSNEITNTSIELKKPDVSSLLSLKDAKILNNITDQAEYMKIYVNLTGARPFTPKVAFRKLHQRKSLVARVEAPKNALTAICYAEPTMVNPNQPEDRSYILLPLCFRVPRCGGCCYNPGLLCQPTRTKMVKYTFTKIDPIQNTYSPHVEDIEVHQSCECGCKIQEKDCIERQQKYDADTCSCKCQDTEKKCNPKIHRWDENSCECKCKTIHNCSTGFTFDHASCGCGRSTFKNDLKSSFMAQSTRTNPLES